MVNLVRATGTLRRCLAVLALALVSTAATLPDTAIRAETAPQWTGTWEAAPSGTTPALPGASIRNVVHISVGGIATRVHLSNRFGRAPLRLDAVTVALRLPDGPTGAEAVPGSLRSATFDGATSVTVPAGQDRVTDPVLLHVPADADLLVTVHTPADSGPATYHRTALQTNYVARQGNRTADTGGAAYTATVASWYYVTEVDVLRPAAAASVVALGDSLTDGNGSSPDANRRWPDLLSERLRTLPASRRPGVLNAGISGNRLLLDGVGPNALARLDADVVGRTGVRTVVVLEGVNDLKGKPPQTDPGAFVRAYRRIVTRAHAHGIRVIGATLTPFGGHGSWTPARERLRHEINAFIRSGLFDGVADFDAAVRDPARPARISPAYDPGDHLHFNDAGMTALAAAIDLTALLR
ncbi:SGNH/GDSL hydrolase family protein [Streptomyces chiangmaiensis]|uniref:SGNH/GDSL hydrolase family protein n=1 Tax=Streptomyces chiangmaiensis TaxID=766497 RepID=A0ABU7F9J9_9ACTN|nr:SGNH/GDSL hydrolase family protein [Streptomyces chiangmaiensis]MED7820745.1 SGNH/GDSL hydrolase family protein [Streptomyces chiangmaiensis]